MEKIKIVDCFEQLKDGKELITLIQKQMKVIGGDANCDRLLMALENSLKPESRVKIFILEMPDNSIGGFAFCNICSGLETGADYLWLNEIFIDLPFRRKGLAEYLLQYIESWCKKNKIKSILFITDKTNQPAQMLYKKLDFNLKKVIWVEKDL